MSSQTLIESIYERIVQTITKQHIGIADIADIAAKTIILVQKVNGLSNPAKKQLVIDVIKMIIEKTDLVPDDKLADVNFYIDEALPDLIDTLVQAYKDRKSFKVPSCLSCK